MIKNLEQEIKFQIIDIECINGFFSYQWRNEDMENSKWIECYSDNDIIKFYNGFKKINRSLYCYSINYDRAMLNAVCKLIENKKTNLIAHLRRINDFFIKGHLNYFEINREFWGIYFDNEDCFDDKRELYDFTINTYKEQNSHNRFLCAFIDEYDYILGQSKTFKAINIIEVPKMLYYFSVRKDGIFMTVGLKNLQMYEEKTNITHNFNELFDIDEIKKQGLFEDFKKYSLNDVDFLFRHFERHCLPIIRQRLYACKAIKKFDKSFEWNEKMIHSNNNTNLLVKAFTVPESQKAEYDDKLFTELDELCDIHNGNYTIENDTIKYNSDDDDDFRKAFEQILDDNSIDFKEIYKNIKPTGYEKFDKYVEFISNNTDIKSDKKLKELYCEEFERTYIKDDKTIFDTENNIVKKEIKSFDEFEIFGTIVKIGNGGIHGAIPNYKGKNLWLDDYESLYPSIMLLFKKYYKYIINIELYEALYEYRNYEIKPRLKKIDSKLDQIYLTIDRGGNDFSDIIDNEYEISNLETEKKLLQNLDSGSKLLLNSLYGLLNSEFNFSIANKILGRFICLYGQYRAIELCKLIKKESPESNLVNINTDGIAVDNITKEIINKINKIDVENGLKLEGKKIDELIQIDVNNYIKTTNGKQKTKGGSFATGLKQGFAKTENLQCNMINALRLINKNPKVEILPILFHNTSKKSSIVLEGEDSSRYKVYYLTSKDKGKRAIKLVNNPIVLSLDGEIMYFTEKKENACIHEYQKFAIITEKRINNFRLTEKDNLKYYKYKLSPEEDKKLITKRGQIKKELTSIFKKGICMTGYKGSHKNVLCIDNKPIQDLSNYTMTQIKASKEVLGFSIQNRDDLTAIYTKNQDLINKYKEYKTFEVIHSISGIHCFIFDENIDIEDSMKQINTEYIPVYTFNGDYKYIVY